MQRFPSKAKAIDLAIWQNNNHRFNDTYGVVLSSKGDYMVLEADHPSFENSEFEKIPADYSKMKYKDIAQIAMDDDPLPHWEEIRGMVSTVHGETLRFILKTNIPFEKFIRYELASRGYDENFKWVGFDNAEEIWLK